MTVAVSFLQASLSKVSRHSHWGARPATRAETPPMNANDKAGPTQQGTYQSGPHTSWLKIRNQHYSQWDGRRELFEGRRDNAERRTRWVKPELALR